MLNKHYGALYENKRDVPYQQFVDDCQTSFIRRYGYRPEYLHVAEAEQVDVTIPVTQMKRVTPANCVLYPVVIKRLPKIIVAKEPISHE